MTTVKRLLEETEFRRMNFIRNSHQSELNTKKILNIGKSSLDTILESNE